MAEMRPASPKRWDLIAHAGKYGIGFWDPEFKVFEPVIIFGDIYTVRRFLKQIELKLALLETEEERSITAEVEKFLEEQKGEQTEDPH